MQYQEENNMDNMDKQKFIFGGLFLLANKLQVIGDQHLGKEDMTTKQWFLTAMISQFGDKAPTLSEVGELMGSSRQNVKQLALKLKEKGFLTIEKDDQDFRALRLKLTEKSRVFWGEREEKDNEFIVSLFNNFNEDEINVMFSSFSKLAENIDKLGKAYK
jgi:DNA-binding MarR family transcriptional regulator